MAYLLNAEGEQIRAGTRHRQRQFREISVRAKTIAPQGNRLMSQSEIDASRKSKVPTQGHRYAPVEGSPVDNNRSAVLRAAVPWDTVPMPTEVTAIDRMEVILVLCF